MSIAIDSLISNQHNLLSSISHELKTPLTRLQLSTALVRHQTGDIEPVKRIEKEIQRMDKNDQRIVAHFSSTDAFSNGTQFIFHRPTLG